MPQRTEYKKAWYEANKARCLARDAAYRDGKKEQTRSRHASYRAANAAKVKAARDAWRSANPQYQKRWMRENPDKNCAYVGARRARLLRATASWANAFLIEEAYKLAALRTKMLGSEWHVDHIVPLQSKLVCGLHVESNLRVIPAVANLSKHNRHWPDMPMPSVAGAVHPFGVQ